MNQSKSGPGVQPSALRQFGWVALCLLVLLGFLFRDGLLPGRTVFSNDGPLGAISSKCARLPAGFFGVWHDVNWLGGIGPSASPSVSNVMAFVLGPLIFSKIYTLVALLFLGLSAWLCFRQWKFSPTACFLGGIAAALNSDFFSTACWGVASQPLSFGCDFLALAALADETSPRRWLRVALAGFAVGLGVMEAFDIGAIFSLVVAAFVVFQALAGEGTMPKRLAVGVARLAVVVAFAAFIAISAVSTLVSTQIKGVAGMGQDAASKAQRWDEATMWSMPKAETLSMVVPGLFGFRMDTPEGGNYWGRCGRHGSWDRYFASGKQEPRPDSRVFPIRYGGGGIYTGVVVVLIALWTVFQAFRKQNSVFSLAERKFIWFWSGVALVCVLVGFGRFAPFYQLFYALPFASTMRNPSKFFHVVEWILVILFAYGVHGLSRSYLEAPTAATRGLSAQLKAWWVKAAAFDKIWVRGSAVALAASMVGWFIYSASRERLMAYLQEVDFDAAMAGAIASFSIRQVGWFILFLALALGLLALLLSGYFNGRRARAGAILLGLLLAVDLGRANVPWVITWNWVQKYATNEVIDFLQEKPYEHRVAVLPFPVPPQFSRFSSLYDLEWKQQLFQFYNIQSLDIIMMPRPPADYRPFESALFCDGTSNTMHRVTRRWQLTNTRYLLGPAGFLEPLNRDLDPIRQRFRIKTKFHLEGKPGFPDPTSYDELTAVITPNGEYAVFDFTGALPRAKLYANWMVTTNDQVTLTNLASAEFDPERTVLVADPSVPNPQPSTVNSQPSTNSVEFTSYAPKHIVLQAKADRPSVLLLNDKYDPNWKVSVNGKPAALLRCNYLMRGVYLPPGTHTVEFSFAPPVDTLYVSVAAVFVSLLLIGYLALNRQKDPLPEPSSAKKPRPVR
jgi:Bacterial membrane protein YfhO